MNRRLTIEVETDRCFGFLRLSPFADMCAMSPNDDTSYRRHERTVPFACNRCPVFDSDIADSPVAPFAPLVRTEKALAVEMDEVFGRVGNPDFGFPCDLRQVSAHGRSMEKRGHEDQARGGAREEILELVVAQHVDRAVRRDGFD